jgi:segregation and condensation protein B
MNAEERKVEAILFTVGKEITAERIGSLCSLDIKKVDKICKGLMKSYSESDNALQLVQKENGWKLTVQDEFVPLVSSIVSATELEQPLMQTLAVIAWKYPVVQSEVIKLRNQSAYEHMKELGERGFVEKEKFGRTYKIKLTKKFFEYFDLPSKEAKEAFLKQVPQEVLDEAENVHKEADEVERLIDLEQKEEESKDELKAAMEEVQS